MGGRRTCLEVFAVKFLAHRNRRSSWQGDGRGQQIAGVAMLLRTSAPMIPTHHPVDRPSPAALAISRGTQRLLVTLGLSCVAELPLASGRRADLVGLRDNGDIWIVEIKSSVEDYRADRKWADYRKHCDRLFFATAAHVPLNMFSADAGLILADSHGAEVVREAPEHRLHAATRRSVTLAFARAAARRLQAIHDPHANYECGG